MYDKTVELLTFLIKTTGNQCPPRDFFPFDEKRLLTLARQNKALPFLFHFLNCPLCHQKLTKKTLQKLEEFQKFNSTLASLFRKEKRKLGRFCQKEKIKVVVIKDFSSYPKMTFHRRYIMGNDIDILVHSLIIWNLKMNRKKITIRKNTFLTLKNIPLLISILN